MKIKIIDVAANLNIVKEKIFQACTRRSPEFKNIIPRLVAVCKIEPASLILVVYEAGQKHFGGNYINELEEKAFHPDLITKDIRWHFIGHLQRNKVNKVLAVPNLHMIETINTDKLASVVDTAWQKFEKEDSFKLNIVVQINTSKKEEKSERNIEHVFVLVKHVIENSKNLKFVGIMTIGAYGYDVANGPNPDFLSLVKCREDICKELNINIDEVKINEQLIKWNINFKSTF